MPKERLSMRKIKEVLRLRFEQGLSHRVIACSCGIGVNTAREYLVRAQAAGLSWPLPEDLLDEALERMLFAAGPAASSGEEDRELPDWSAVRLELCRKKGVTLQLLWQEYRAAHPDGYGYSRYCELYRAWTKTLDVTMRFTHQAGEVLFVDYAGETMEVTNPQTGEIIPVYVFVGALGASNYTYAEPTFASGHLAGFIWPLSTPRKDLDHVGKDGPVGIGLVLHDDATLLVHQRFRHDLFANRGRSPENGGHPAAQFRVFAESLIRDARHLPPVILMISRQHKVYLDQFPVGSRDPYCRGNP